MKTDWWCANCEAVRELDIHGDCACCGSAAVCIAAPPRVEGRQSLRVSSLLEVADRVLERHSPSRQMARAALELHRVRRQGVRS